MENKIQPLYKGKFSLLSVAVFFLVLNIVAIGLSFIFKYDSETSWAIFQALLFSFGVIALTIGGFTNANIPIYYVSVAVLFFIFYEISVFFPREVFKHPIEEIPYFENIVSLNVLFFIMFIFVTLAFRFLRTNFEKM
ncbi:MAG: hypothetical protein M9887_04090 [Chitinophagales bacterium]|nr:hypothetical protein [Chitinophagales bacterium]